MQREAISCAIRVLVGGGVSKYASLLRVRVLDAFELKRTVALSKDDEKRVVQ